MSNYESIRLDGKFQVLESYSNYQFFTGYAMEGVSDKINAFIKAVQEFFARMIKAIKDFIGILIGKKKKDMVLVANSNQLKILDMMMRDVDSSMNTMNNLMHKYTKLRTKAFSDIRSGNNNTKLNDDIKEVLSTLTGFSDSYIKQALDHYHRIESFHSMRNKVVSSKSIPLDPGSKVFDKLMKNLEYFEKMIISSLNDAKKEISKLNQDSGSSSGIVNTKGEEIAMNYVQKLYNILLKAIRYIEETAYYSKRVVDK